MRIRKAMATARRCGLLATGAAVVGIVGIVGSVGVVGVAHAEVDGAVALVMGLDRAMKNGSGGGSVYDGRGLLILG